MKLSETALQTLKNFSMINPGIVIKPGKIQRTVSTENTIYGEAELEDDFPCEFGIYDLHKFLKNITTMNDPDLEFQNNCVLIKDSSMVMTYYSCVTNAVTVPSKTPSPGTPKTAFGITEAQLKKLMEVSAMNEFPAFTITGSADSGISIKCHDNSNDTSNHVMVNIGAYDGASFKTNIKTSNLKIIPGDYEISIFDSFTRFQNVKRKLTYFIGIEKGAKK